MSSKVEVQVLEESVKKSYDEIISEDQNQNKSRAQQLAVLPADAKQQIVEATKYSSYYPNPITQEFMEKYILAPIEFPTVGSGLAQALTELNVRIDNLFNDHYMHEKAKLEAEDLELEIEELERDLSKEAIALLDAGTVSQEDTKDLAVEDRRVLNKVKRLRLEQVNKNHSLKKIELAAMARYNEAMGWKKTVEKKMEQMGVKDLSEVDFNRIRMDEMQAKIKKWGELHAQGALELTPSKFQAIDSNKEAFAQGVQEGAEKIQRAQIAHQEAQKLLDQASGVVGKRPQ